MLSPHVFLLAILFRHNAFISEELNANPHLLSNLKVFPSAKELRLKLKDSMVNKFVFRRCEKTASGFVMPKGAGHHPRDNGQLNAPHRQDPGFRAKHDLLLSSLHGQE